MNRRSAPAPAVRLRPAAVAWWSVAVLAALAYLPALTAKPGRMPADSKLYLYLDPGRLLGDAASSFDPRQFAGWVPHQHIGYLWPAGPWFWIFDAIGMPDWIAHRLWIGSLLVAAGLGVRWIARLLGIGPGAALVAAVVYQLSPYVLAYVSRTSVMLLPWAGLGWVVGLTIRATRRRTWGDPAALALVVLTIGGINATALAMIVPAPVLWLVHVGVRGRRAGAAGAEADALTWLDAARVAGRITALAVPVCLWWMTMLVIQARHGAEVLPYSESLADVSLTATASEVWRGLGYWLFYVRDPYAATTTESMRYLTSSVAIAISYLVPIVCLAGLAFVRWAHRRFAALLVAAGAVLAVGVHPIGNRSPLMRLLAGDDEAGLALALRSSTRAVPVMTLGLALMAGALVAALGSVGLPGGRRSWWWRADVACGAVVVALAVVNLPAIWNGALVDPALARDQDPPPAWDQAAARLDATGTAGRVLQVPGSEFGAYRWGYTVDQPLPGMTDKPLVTRDLLPLGSPQAMDLLFALDDRIQSSVLESPAVAPVARWLGVDMIWITNDLAYERFRTARPRVLGAQIATAPAIGRGERFGPPTSDQPEVAMTDPRSLADANANRPASPVELYPVQQPGRIVRAGDRTVVVSGSGDGLVDAAAAGLLDGTEVVRYSGSLEGDELRAALADAERLIVTDSNRDRARHWRSSQDTTGYTESDQPGLGLLREVASDRRLPVFADADDDRPIDPATQTIARQLGPVRATATAYGEPFAYLPERRPYMAIDGDLTTAWTVGEHADPIGETLRLDLDTPVASIRLVQPHTGGRQITAVEIGAITVDLDETSLTPQGQSVDLAEPAAQIDITIAAVGGGEPETAGAVAGVGLAEVITGLGPTLEAVRPPHDALTVVDPELALTIELTRLRADAMDRWRSDPEPHLVRQFELSHDRALDAAVELRIDRRAADRDVAALFGWPAWASTRLTGSLASAGVAAVDGDPATSWITAFGEARGATLTVATGGATIGEMSLRQPVGAFSAITAVTLRSGSEVRTVDLVPDAAGVSTASIEPPLRADAVEVELTGIDAAMTVDRRYGDRFELPAAVSELRLGNVPPATPISESRAELGCTTIFTIDGVPRSYRVVVDGAAAVAGTAFSAQACAAPEQIAAGAHLIRAQVDPALALDLDRVVLSSGTHAGDGEADPVATVLGGDRFGRTIEVAGCPQGCWLVFGEGYNQAWEASGPAGSLGEPQLVDGGFNGWWVSASERPVRIEVRWSQQRPLEGALLISALAAVLAVAVIAYDRRRHPGPTPRPDIEPVIDVAATAMPLRRALVAGVAWTVIAGLVVEPEWALAGAAAGLAAIAFRRTRVAELTALATLVTVGTLVVVRERRNSPAPNGAWPAVFESWHPLAMFAFVAVAVAAITADETAAAAAPGTIASGPIDDERDRPLAVDEGQDVG